MKRSTRLSWFERLGLVALAATPALACISGATEGLDDAAGGASALAGSASVAGSLGVPQAGANGAGGSTAGTNGLGGAAPTAGAPQGGVAHAGGTSVAGGGGAPLESCDFSAWVAGQDYAAGDKVMYQGRAFVATEANPGYDPLISTYFWTPYDCAPVSTGGGGSGGSGNQSSGDCVLDKLLPSGEASFHALFVPPWQGHQEKPLYSYSALCQALKTHDFGRFANSGNLEADKREVAAFFAHVAKETAFLEQTDEAGQPSNAPGYHGRGAIQLTGHSNYMAAGAYLNKDLLQNPGLVSTDPLTNWQVALWFWVVHSNPGTPGTKNCHQAILAGDFAQTTRIINGGIECPGTESARIRAQYYQNNCSALGISPGTSLVC